MYWRRTFTCGDRSASALRDQRGDGFVGFELGHVRLALQERGLGRFHLRVGLAGRRAFRRLERVWRFLFKFAIQGAARHQLTDPCILRLPTRNIGVCDVSRLGRADIGLGGRHGSLRRTLRLASAVASRSTGMIAALLRRGCGAPIITACSRI